MAVAVQKLHFTGNDEADALLASEPFARLVGFALDQQVSVQSAATDPATLLDAFREKPAIHRFPGSMAERVQQLARLVEQEYDGDASRLWTGAADGADLRARIAALPGFGEMKIKALGSVLAKRLGVEAAQDLVPNHPTLGDVDSGQALEEYQAKKRAYKAKLRAEK